MDTWKKTLSSSIGELTSELIEVSRQLHSHPELGGEERFACDLLIPILQREGFHVTRDLAGLATAFVATKQLAGKGPRVAYLAEYDALPGLGHACGHNWIAAASLGAALALARVSATGDGLGGEVLLIGTPGEENIGGKVTMTDAGLFDGLDAALMVHPSRRNVVDRTSQASCPLEFEFRGKSAHAAAAPEQGINALDALRLMFDAVDLLRRGSRDDARLPGVIVHGGDAPNVIPDRAVARFSLRAADKQYVDHLRERLEECARGAAMATRTTVTWHEYEPQYLELISNPVLVRLFREQLARLGVEEFEVEAKGTGALDIGNVSHRVPAIHPDIAIVGPDVGVHTAAFCEAALSDRAAEMLPVAAEALAGTGLALLENPALAEEARRCLSGRDS